MHTTKNLMTWSEAGHKNLSDRRADAMSYFNERGSFMILQISVLSPQRS
jgi:hypothetical protein